MKLKLFLAALAVLIVFGVLAGVKAVQVKTMIEAGHAAGPPPEAVDVGPVRVDTWETARRSIGSVSAVEGVIVRTEVAGVVERIRFEAGQRVEPGAILVELEASIERANLAQARADADLAHRSLKRAKELFESGTVSEADHDQAVARVAETEARVASLEATLAKKTIRAAFAGYLGIKQISVGQYLQPGYAVVALQALDRVLVDFSLPQRDLAAVAPGLAVRAVDDAAPDRPLLGTLAAIDPQIDLDTRNFRLQATFDNPGQRLRPGMFVSVELVLGDSRRVVAVPSTAVLYAPYGSTVFVVNEGAGEGTPLTVEQRIVRLGQAKGDFVEITEGLTGGERVVTAGAFKLRSGQAIVVSDRGTRPPSLAPTPADS
jgi:membrane fusion protein (multidrug efflux system)